MEPFCTQEDLAELKKQGIIVEIKGSIMELDRKSYPIQPEDLTEEGCCNNGFCGLQRIQIQIINNAIRKAYIPSKGSASIWCKTLADELGTPVHVDSFVGLYNDIEKAYSKARWKVEIEGLTQEGYAGNAYIVFSKK